MNIRYLLLHPEWGIYIGAFLGMGFWSKLDPVGQNYAISFPSTDVLDWARSTFPGEWMKMTAPPIQIKDKMYATLAEIVAAGLEGWDPDQEIKNETV